ncbi:PEP/pyruvate-binding domain-containing protein [Maridesulfovibrio sp.]|uniref:PEP/pyruvate-binding domain-containing protein n=1 Tax=Maridesulfovibrio sp. TaxID=2795000 RepID=UPI002A1888E3|nr:PEP/pyruvate-binding domain-containing protein [Maridesulfovibrio sp.]
MRTFINAISRILRNPSAADRSSSARFLERCENFRLLLSANNSALKRMAELTEASRSVKPVGMTYIRAENVRISADVRNMIERLCRIAPGRYETLKDAFNRILVLMNKELAADVEKPTGSNIINLQDLNSGLISEVGSKMALLGEIASIPGIRVPDGFSITASAFRNLLRETGLGEELKRVAQICGEGNYATLKVLERNIKEAISLCQFPQDLENEISAAAEQLAAGRRLTHAVRSSALCEDSLETSFAGQFHTELGVASDEVVEAYRNVIASMYTASAVTYRLNHGIRDDEMVMCVGCVEMIDAVAGGVAYSRDPSGLHEGQIVVSAVHGLPSSLVDGVTRSDLWRLDRESLAVLYEEIVDQEWGRFMALDGSVVRRRLGTDQVNRPSIDLDVLVRIGQTVLDLEDHFNCPQDMEWSLTGDGIIYVLQCRPLGIMSQQEAQESFNEDQNFPLIVDSCQPASSGIASGIPYYIEHAHDMIDFPFGGVLLTRVAGPELAALLPDAVAVIAEFGSCTGHLANVAREYGIPALIGVPDAVEKLNGVGEVIVDAVRGRILSGSLDKNTGPHKTRNPDTPVRRALSSVLKLITPLTLTDPRSPEFIPERCETLHDITRFCHEKAVAEMFKERAGIDNSARQMLDGEKLQYWIIDLGGGISENSASNDDGYVRFEDIRSNAMKSLWAGMTGFPWEGPPDVCIDGFASVLFGATCNPALVPGLRNSMGERSYFIVGRNYCSLQSRLGFHYCTIEGFAGDDTEMNYVLFQFKGGAADMGRRSLRLRLVAEILAEHGFHTAVRDDVLFARMEGISLDIAERGLVVAGYLLVQTRQLDMIMKDGPAVENYRNKFHREIEILLAGGGK